jgi:hypothetical protein
MTTAELIRQIREQASSLSGEERERVANELMAAAEDIGHIDSDDDFDVSPELAKTIEERVKSIDDGTVVLIPADEAFARLRARFQSR